NELYLGGGERRLCFLLKKTTHRRIHLLVFHADRMHVFVDKYQSTHSDNTRDTTPKVNLQIKEKKLIYNKGDER
ncbi:hypothetical protein ACJX0J_032615, partial [Zea mays]